MNITRYKARINFLLGQLRHEADLQCGLSDARRLDIIDNMNQLRHINRHLHNHTVQVLDSYIWAAEAVIIGAASSRAFPKRVKA